MLAAGSDQAVAMCRFGHTTKDCSIILVATILASTLAFLDGAVINVALPRIGHELHADGSLLQWLMTVYLLPLGALQLLAGAFGDHYGHRRILFIGTTLFTLASLGCALAGGITDLLAARAVQGLGAALLLPNSLAVLGTAFDGNRRPKAVATWTSAGAIASALGPPLAGWMIDEASWRLVFLLNLPVGIAALGIIVWKVPETRSETLPLDVPGTALATFGLLCLSWAITDASASGVTSGTAGLAMIAFAALAGLLWLEDRRGPRAMMPPKLFASRLFAGLTVYTFLVYAAFGALFMLLPFTLIRAVGYSAAAAGASLLPLPILLGFASSTASSLSIRHGSRAMLAAGAAVSGVGYFLLRDVGGGSYWTHVFPGVVFIAVGSAALVSPLTAAVLSSVESAYTATAAGFNSAISRAGSLIAIAASGAVIMGTPESMLRSFHTAAFVGFAVCTASAVIVWRLLPREVHATVP
jgi:EmrB/QacA subfamily drug resistance transporter